MSPALQVQSCVPLCVSSAYTFLLLVCPCCDVCRLELRSAAGRALGTAVAKSSPSSPSCTCVSRQGQSVIEEWEMHSSREGLKLNSLWHFFLTSLTLAQNCALGEVIQWNSNDLKLLVYLVKHAGRKIYLKNDDMRISGLQINVCKRSNIIRMRTLGFFLTKTGAFFWGTECYTETKKWKNPGGWDLDLSFIASTNGVAVLIKKNSPFQTEELNSDPNGLV